MTLRRNTNSELSKAIALFLMMITLLAPTFLTHTYLRLTGNYGNLASDRVQLLTDALLLSKYIYLALFLCAFIGFLIYFLSRKSKEKKGIFRIYK